MRIALGSDSIMPSLIHSSGYTAAIDAATMPTALPPMRRPSKPIITTAAMPRKVEAKRCHVTVSRPRRDHSER